MQCYIAYKDVLDACELDSVQPLVYEYWHSYSSRTAKKTPGTLEKIPGWIDAPGL